MTASDPVGRGTPPSVAPEAGLSRQRTMLAWQRSALSALALGLGLLRLGALAGSAPQVAAAVVVLLAAVALAVVPLSRGTPDRWRTTTSRATAAIAACVFVAGALAVAGALLA